MVDCRRIIVSAPIPVPLLWTLDFRLWVLDLGLGLENKTFYDLLCPSMIFHIHIFHIFTTQIWLFPLNPPNIKPSMSKDPLGYLGFLSQDIEFRNIKP